ncbi:21863_t:CDS:2 [Cetraspora pellucida]|uniref:21863_t:CDS:1 n=1 Tax=Cetraspora pellucida TaxID=1433469 RepID=A0A9N9F631_9GLOM|nr:21863_t:CDS:2 [Cetraspora pellucida]
MQFGHKLNKIKQYIDAKYIGTAEAAWCLFDKAVIKKGADYNTIYPTKFLNILKSNRMPPLRLNLKIDINTLKEQFEKLESKVQMYKRSNQMIRYY